MKKRIITKGMLFFYCLGLMFTLSPTADSSESAIFSCIVEQYSRAETTPSGLPNPALRGSFRYSLIHYGDEPSLFDFSQPDLISPRVDLPEFLSNFSRNQGYTQDAFHQSKQDNLPLHAKVWLTQDDKPRPLVVLVHGNSDPGFDYLGELLASRGYVVVQIDQTYLNGMWGENGARGWLLLEHLKLLRAWNTQPGHLFYNTLNLQKIALIGMSRGGEAVALAATFNQWHTVPGSMQKTDFGFDIESVVALAPMDSQYQHATGLNPLRNVNYLVLQGGHDADVYQFLGSQQWHRTYFDPDGDYAKHSIYIYRANHINFNQSMSDDFLWGKRKQFYAKLLSPEQQETLTKVFVSAFLEATLFGNKAYLNVLHAPTTGEFGLPDDVYVTRFMTSDFNLIEDFEGSVNTLHIARQAPEEVTKAVPVNVASERLRDGTPTSNHVLTLTLDALTMTSLTFKVSGSTLLSQDPHNKAVLRFSLARVDPAKKPNCDPYNLLQDTEVELRDSKGRVFAMSLSALGSLAPLLSSDYSELEGGGVQYSPTEPLLQTFTIPINVPGLITNASEFELVLRFAPRQAVTIILDDVGISSQ